jgi:hypothetical protein
MSKPFPLTRRGVGAVALAASLAVAGCASRPDVRHDQDPSADLRAYKTFAFTDLSSDNGEPYTAMLASRLKLATRAQMERQHYAYDASRPELLVNLRLVVREKQEIRSHSYGRASWRGWPAASDIQTVDYRQGTLTIDLIDPERRLLVWHGVAEGRLDAKAMEQPGPAIEAAVGEIFARFPGAQP